MPKERSETLKNNSYKISKSLPDPKSSKLSLKQKRKTRSLPNSFRMKDNLSLNQTLEDINKQIQTKCPELNVELLYKNGDRDYELQLKYNTEIISTVQLYYHYHDRDEKTYDVMIDRDTKKKYENRKYMKLLTSITIQIINLIEKNKKIKNIVSFAINPISYYLLNIYKIIVTKDKTIIYNDNDIKENIENRGGVVIYLPINRENIEIAKNIFSDLVNGETLICIENPKFSII